MKTSVAWLLVFLILLPGCGYHFTSQGDVGQSCKTLSVPYIEGDTTGEFTSALIHQLASSGRWTYAPNEDGDLTLNVTLLKTKDEEIGYSYAVENGQVNKWLVPNENRLSQLVKVELVETNSKKPILGPFFISSSVRYDYDPNFNVTNLVRFSLAQFNFQEIARRTAQVPLNERLSTDIVNYLNYAW